MKISISYPPLESAKGVPLLSQNRQFQWFNNPTYIYPVVPAYAASLLAARGHEVFWDDGIAEELSFDRWFARLKHEQPDLMALESKTPVIKRHWEIIKTIKRACSWNPLIVLFGDHVTALPQESLENSPVDYVITGGDYDFVLADLCDYVSAANPQSAIPGGVWYRANGSIASTGKPDLHHVLDNLPGIDRDLTQWKRYAYKNGNFKYTPGTYVMAGRDCWWGACTFCAWTCLYPANTYRTISVEKHLDEIGRLIKDYGIREIFDDSGCFPTGGWLEEFCRGIIRKGYHKQVVLGCNMRCGALSEEEWRLMRYANFRFVLIGLESVNQATLDRLQKGITVSQIEETLRLAKSAGLEPHVTVMVGYPWETKEDADNTIAFAKKMFAKGYIHTLQATIVVPYPGTPMFDEARNKNWLTTEDWDRYDMKQSVWKSPVSRADVLRLTRKLYKTALSPGVIARRLCSIRNIDDLRFMCRAGVKVLAHIADFTQSR